MTDVPNTSWAAARNADLRAALTTAYPGVPFAVRNGRHGMARIRWTDGPTTWQVERTIKSVPCPIAGHGHWSYDVDRDTTEPLIAVGLLRAHAAGREIYTERQPGSNSVELARWLNADENVDAATITPSERVAAALTLELARNDPRWGGHRPSQAIARTVALHADTIRTVLA